MGVIDPLDAKVDDAQGTRQADHAARRVGEGPGRHHHRQRDQGDRAKRRRDQRYVRVPGPEADLRRQHQGRAFDPVRRLDRDQPAQGRSGQDPPHRVRQLQDSRGREPGRLALQRGEKLVITRKDGSAPWTMDGISAGEQLNENNLRTLSDALADLKIVGIRPAAGGLGELDQEDLKVSPVVLASLTNKGFFLTRRGFIPTRGTSRSRPTRGSSTPCATAGRCSPKATSWSSGLPTMPRKERRRAGKEKDKAKKSQTAQENRYLMVTVSFDPTMIAKPESMEPKPFVEDRRRR